MLIFLWNAVYSLLIKREPAEANPWGSKGMEWQYEMPLPLHDFDTYPVFDDDPYPYGVGQAGQPAATPAS
jgi:heme/copper-type cytochrome/quinol oxidase subunit 1